LDLVNVSKIQTGQVIKALLGIFKKKYDVYLIPILLHCLRFLSQLFITQDKMISVKSISELNCPVIEEFLLAADQLVNCFVCSGNLMANDNYKGMILTNCMPGMCHKKVAELVIQSYKRILQFQKHSLSSFVNLTDIDFFNRWSINVEILDNNAYTGLFHILSELLTFRNWNTNTKNILLMMIRVRQIDGNVTIFDFLLKKLRTYVSELGTYEKTHFGASVSTGADTKTSRTNGKFFSRINLLISIINGILNKIHDYESLHCFLGFLGKLWDKGTGRDFIEKVLLSLDGNYSLDIFKNRPNPRILNKTQLSMTVESDNSEHGKSDFVDNEMMNLLGRNDIQHKEISELYANSESDTQKSYSSSDDPTRTNLPKKTKDGKRAKPLLKRNALDQLIKRMKYGYFGTNIMTMISETPTDMSMVRKSAKEFNYKRFFDCPFRKKTDYSIYDQREEAFKKAKPLPLPDNLKNTLELDKMDKFFMGKKDLHLNILGIKNYVVSLEQRSIAWFFKKYNKLLGELFRVYSGTLKAKKWHFGDLNYTCKGLLHYSEFWNMLKEIGYSGRHKIPQIVMIIKD
jgi:hypothetical protein